METLHWSVTAKLYKIIVKLDSHWATFVQPAVSILKLIFKKLRIKLLKVAG